MDDDLKLVERLKNGALEAGYHGYDGTVLQDASKAITRLHAEIEALKSDVDELVRAGSDEATEVERLREALRQIAAVRPEVVTHVPEGFEPVLSCQQIASRTLEGGEG